MYHKTDVNMEAFCICIFRKRRNVKQKLLKEGYAKVVTYPPNVKYVRKI